MNPSAFPQSLTGETGAFVGCEGMTLRDYFAAAALTGLLASSTGDQPENFAKGAYLMADAMLAAREDK